MTLVHSNSLENVSPPVEKILLICGRCSEKLLVSEDQQYSANLQKHLKKIIKETLPKGYARAVLTSCLNLCPPNKIAIGCINIAEPKAAAFFHLSKDTLENDGDKLLGLIKK